MKNGLILLFLVFCSATIAQIINFPDANFKWAIKTTICADSNGDGIHDRNADFNNDGEIDLDEAFKIVHLRIDNREIANLEGIQNFKNLKALNCYDNKISDLGRINSVNHPKLTTINCRSNRIAILSLENFPVFGYLNIESNGVKMLSLKQLPLLTTLHARSNALEELNLIDLPNLKEININNNDLKSVKLDGLVNLTNLHCQYNRFITLNLSGLKNLKNANCQYNYLLEEINLEGLDNLESLALYKNKLKTLEMRNLINLKICYANSANISSIHLENLPRLEEFGCYDNKLNTMFIKVGSTVLKTLNFSNNPTLSYICCDENNIIKIKDLANKNGQNNCEVNSYCTFTPGGKYYILKGENRYDEDSIGCDQEDIKLPNLKYQIKQNNNLTGVYISNASGNYSIPVQAGTNTISPMLENPDHFQVTPSSITVTFPSTSDTIIQNFCITPKGIFRQTNITVIPLTPPARPGFDAKYKIVWENEGNQIESGTLNFTYDERLLDYILATQTADQVADGIIKWNFTNLLPFEKREITVTLKVNRPTDTPAVNAGDKLYLTASILDNIFTLENTVVGSYDPNDKTCLHGERVKPDMVGKYVDYLIRFENTGNYAAENVVVKDIIDTKRFDVSTLQITDASHEVYTRIEGNKVEFIFENIQLPFDDANNDGYIAFKIKTLPSLVLGDSLKNLADIYFDYNFPIRTNEAKTTIALPSSAQDWITDINIYPNPVKDILNLETNENWTKAEIYDIAGRIIRSLTLNSNSIDVSNLESGSYFMRLKDGEKIGRVKFVKL